MHVLVIGAGRTGSEVIQQLRKNPRISISTADARSDIYAVTEGIIDKVDIREPITPLNLDDILDQYKPDLVLLAMPTEDMGMGEAPGVEMLSDALRDELVAVSKSPIIEVSRGVASY